MSVSQILNVVVPSGNHGRGDGGGVVFALADVQAEEGADLADVDHRRPKIVPARPSHGIDRHIHITKSLPACDEAGGHASNQRSVDASGAGDTTQQSVADRLGRLYRWIAGRLPGEEGAALVEEAGRSPAAQALLRRRLVLALGEDPAGVEEVRVLLSPHTSGAAGGGC
ncbi:hypothetical protein [Streptomyces sp. NPDC058678]|uniref:hypothetical protein n=1 Tax=Streptomyces sp. NPDC058678 TaxID=3346595 RepID=UPI003655A114